MPNTADLNSAIRGIVADEAAAVLAPYQGILARMADFVGGTAAPATVRRGPGRPRKNAVSTAAAKPVRRKQRRRGSVAKAAARAAKKLSVGQKVSYNVGRGRFEGKVVRVDVAMGKVVVERLTDGKRALRPAAKVKAA